jgi:hypothetical protein
MSFVPTFGSVGDIISVSLIIKDLLQALDDARGSAAEYQAVIRDIHVLDRVLLQVHQLWLSHAAVPEVQALVEVGKATVSNCQKTIDTFTTRIRKYKSSLDVTGGSGKIFKDAARKVQWRMEKDELAKFRVEVLGFTNSISMLLNMIQL